MCFWFVIFEQVSLFICRNLYATVSIDKYCEECCPQTFTTKSSKFVPFIVFFNRHLNRMGSHTSHRSQLLTSLFLYCLLSINIKVSHTFISILTSFQITNNAQVNSNQLFNCQPSCCSFFFYRYYKNNNYYNYSIKKIHFNSNCLWQKYNLQGLGYFCGSSSVFTILIRGNFESNEFYQ